MTIKVAIEYFRTITITAVSILLWGCVDQIEFESEGVARILVVDGRISNSRGPHSLKLGITTGITTSPDKIATPIEGADITIFDNLGNKEDYFEIEPGIYLLQGNIVKGIPGVEYFIEITLPNGSKFRSVPEIMPGEIEITDSVILEFGKEDYISDAGILTSRNVVKVLLDSQIPETTNPVFLRWHAEESYQLNPTQFPEVFYAPFPPPFPLPPCYITEFPSLRRLPLFNGSKFSTGVLDDFHLYSRELDFSFQDRHYFNVIRSTISFNAMDYWEKLDRTANRVGSIFDAPPSPVQGNIYKIDDPGVAVLGFFEAIVTDTTRRFTIIFDLPIFIKSCKWDGPPINKYPDRCLNCLLPPDRNLTRFPYQCLNCLLIPGSSLTRPSYWP